MTPDRDDEYVDAEIVEDTAYSTALAVPDTDLQPTAGHAVDPLQLIREGIAALDAQRSELALAQDYENLAYGVADIALLRGDLTTLERAARADIATILDAQWLGAGKMNLRDDGTPSRLPQEDIEGLGRVKVAGGKERKNWESSSLLWFLIRQAIVDEDGAVVEEPAIDVARRIFDVLGDCLPLTGSLQWRVGTTDANGVTTGLKRYGVDPEDYADHIIKDRLADVPKRGEGSTS